MVRALIELDHAKNLTVEYVRGTVRREALLTRRANRWRGAALYMTALVVTLAWIAGWREYERQRIPTHYIAVLQVGNGKPVFFLKINVTRQYARKR
jgi:hypothetical protein